METEVKCCYMVVGIVAFELAYPFLRDVAYAVLDRLYGPPN